MDVVKLLTDLVNSDWAADIDDLPKIVAEIERLQTIEAAAKNLVAQKGRHNTEVAYKRLEETLK